MFIVLLVVLANALAYNKVAAQDTSCHPCLVGRNLIAQGREEIKKGKALVKENCRDYDESQRKHRSLWNWLKGRHHKKKKGNGKAEGSTPDLGETPEPDQVITNGDTSTFWITKNFDVDTSDSADTSGKPSLVKKWPGGSDTIFKKDGVTYKTSFRSSKEGSSSTTLQFNPDTQSWEPIEDEAIGQSSRTARDTCNEQTEHHFFMLQNTNKKNGESVAYKREDFQHLPSSASIPRKAIASMFRVSSDIKKITFVYHIKGGVKKLEIITKGCVDVDKFKDNLLMHSTLDGYWDLDY